MNIKELDKQFILPTYAREDVAFVSGKGAELFDDTGRRYIDLGSGIAVNTFGAADDVWAEAVCNQAKKLQHVSNYYCTQPQSELAALLCEKSGMKKVFFCNSGAEANECAIKAARKYSNDRYKGARPNILTLVNSFHGRTMATLTATGQEAMHKDFDPFLTGFSHIAANDIGELERAVSKGNVSAIMMELVQGEGGVIALSEQYVKAAAEIAKINDLLLIVDEVQTGNGRTGALYAYMKYGITPDIVTTAKGLAGGLPFGAVLFNERTIDILTAGTHGSTFGGNPVCAAAALSTLRRIDDALLEGVNQKSAYIHGELEGAEGVIGVSGLGLMIGIECTRPAKEIIRGCLERGVIVLGAKAKVRLLPPLNIPMHLLKEALGILKEEMAK